jgi:hypothetical protein
MNRTDPVGATAPGAFVTVAVSATDVPGTTVPVGFAAVVSPGVAFCTVICAAPPAAPVNPEDWPNNEPRESGSVVPVPGVAGFVGIENTRSERLTRHVRLAAGPVAGPSVTAEVGVSDTSPVVGSGAPTVNGTPLHGAVLASPAADSTLKTPGSVFPGRQTATVPLAHAGVTKRVVRETLSVSFGVVDVLMTSTLAEKMFPTVAVGGHVGVAVPPTPACTGVTPRRTSPRITAPTLRPVRCRLLPWVLRIARSSSA